MYDNFLNLKNHLETLAKENSEQADKLQAQDKYAAAEYFMGKSAAYKYASSYIEIILNYELPWEED